MTNQKQIILEELVKLKTHPTADELYMIVKRKLPNISLSTVYRNLIILNEGGYLKKIQFSGGQMRFDGTTDSHDHIKCSVCGKVIDIDFIPFGHVKKHIEDKTDFTNVSYNVEFVGVCPNCQE